MNREGEAMDPNVESLATWSAWRRIAGAWTRGDDEGRDATPHSLHGLTRLIGLQHGEIWRRVLGLALPVVADNLLQTLLGIVDTILARLWPFHAA